MLTIHALSAGTARLWGMLRGAGLVPIPTVPSLGTERKPSTGSFLPQSPLQTPSWDPACPDGSQVSVPAPRAPKSLRKGCVGPAGVGTHTGPDSSWYGVRSLLCWGWDAIVLRCEEVSGETALGRAWRGLKGQAGPQPSAPGLGTFQTEGLTGG